MASFIFELQQPGLEVLVNNVVQFTSLLLCKNAVISDDVSDFVIQAIKHIYCSLTQVKKIKVIYFGVI